MSHSGIFCKERVCFSFLSRSQMNLYWKKKAVLKSHKWNISTWGKQVGVLNALWFCQAVGEESKHLSSLVLAAVRLKEGMAGTWLMKERRWRKMAEDTGAAIRGGISPLLYEGYTVRNCAHTVFVSDYRSHSFSWYRHAPSRSTKGAVGCGWVLAHEGFTCLIELRGL